MRRRLSHSRFYPLVSVSLILMLLLGAISGMAQITTQAPGHAQVIAQGVQDVSAGNWQWYLRVVTVNPAARSAPVEIRGAFFYTEDGQVLATYSTGERQILSPGQGAYASEQNPAMLTTIADASLDLLVVSLESAMPRANGIGTDEFPMEAGAYNLQLTRGILNPGESELFVPTNDLQYVGFVPVGEIRYDTPGKTDGDIMTAGDTLEAEGDLQIANNSPGISTYILMAIGDKIGSPSLIQGSSLEVDFYECPSGWVPGNSLSDCFLSPSPPNVTITNTTGARNSLSTAWDAVSSREGVYKFPALPNGTYLLALDYNELWDLQKTHFFPAAYSDGLDWYVEVSQAQPNPVVQIVLGYVGDGSVNVPGDGDDAIWAPGSMGYAMIVQEECHPGQSDISCTAAISPWEVYLTHQATNEVFVLSVEGVPMGDGVWMLIVPAGPYWVEVVDAGWYMEYSGVMEVFSGTESYLYIRGITP